MSASCLAFNFHFWGSNLFFSDAVTALDDIKLKERIIYGGIDGGQKHRNLIKIILVFGPSRYTISDELVKFKFVTEHLMLRPILIRLR